MLAMLRLIMLINIVIGLVVGLVAVSVYGLGIMFISYKRGYFHD